MRGSLHRRGRERQRLEMITGVHHTGLVVRDLDVAITFFATQGAFRLVSRFDVADNEANRLLLQMPDAEARGALMQGTLGGIELFEFTATCLAPVEVQQVHAAGIRHICLQTEISDALYDAMIAAGASSHARPAGLGTGNSYVYIRDSEGNLLELEGVPWAPAEISRPWFAHTAIVTPDIERLSGFYSMLTGTEVVRQARFGPDPKFDIVAGIEGVRFAGAWMRLANAEIEFWQYFDPPTVPVTRRQANEPGWNHLCFDSDDVDSDYERLAAAGVELHGPPQEFGAARVLFGRDPDGNIFKVLTPGPGAKPMALAAMRDDPAARAVQAARGGDPL